MASGAPPLLPVTTGAAASTGHGRRYCAAGVIKASCLLILIILPISILASKQNRVAFQHMFWRLQGDYDDRVRFDAWMHKYKPWYRNNLVVTNRRFRSFRDNLRYVDKHNAAANYTYRLGLNRNADWPYKKDPDRSTGSALSSVDRAAAASVDRHQGEDLPASVDWRLKGAVGPIRSQRKCGSCWAIATAEAVEGIQQIATGKDLVPLSVQELVDCGDHWGRNHGCSGGYPEDAMGYVMFNGVHTEREYPYVDEQRSCRKLGVGTVWIDSYGAVQAGDERSLQKAVAGQPVTALADFEGRDMDLYESGVYNGPCGTSTNHAVLVVGYGTEGGKDFWIVKNSWSEDWGEGGYIRIQRNSKEDPLGKCAIATRPIYPKFSAGVTRRNSTAN